MGTPNGREPVAFTSKPHRRRAHAGRPSVWLGGLAALLAATAYTPAAHAQQEFAVDVSDPNVQVDLSVLDDGGLMPRMGAPVPPATAAQPRGTKGYREPGPQAPVSTLYIQPSGSIDLPPQSKSLIARTPPEPTPVPPAAPKEDAPEMTAEAPPTSQPSAPPPPPAMDEPAQPRVAETPTVVAPPPPAPKIETPEPVSEPAEVAKAPAPATKPTPAPEPVVQAEPEPAPEPDPAPEVAAAPAPPPPPPPVDDAPTELKTDAQPAPEPTPETTPETTTAQVEETPPPPSAPPASKTAEPSASGSVTIELPPPTGTNQPGVASLPPADDELSSGAGMRIVFEHDSSRLPTDAQDALLQLAEQLNQDDAKRLQLLAYAGDADTSASAARRLSLSRALAVRSFLIENGVRSTRIDVRALGNKSADDVTERVDITIVER